MDQTLTLSGSERITVIESTPSRFEVEATYEPQGEKPPMHMHPGHAEEFTVLAGVLRVGYTDQERDYAAGESFEIPRGVAHRMWNAGDSTASVHWVSTPAGRVESFFRAMDALHRAGTTSLMAKAGVLRAHSDVMRPSSAITRLLVQVLGALRPTPTASPADVQPQGADPMTFRRHLATCLTFLLAAMIGYVGVSYLIDPGGTAPGFGMAAWPEGDAAAFLATKGARDLVTGILPLVLLFTRQRRALGWAMSIIAIVPLLDAALILSTGGSTAMAIWVHALTAVLTLGTGVLLLTERPKHPAAAANTTVPAQVSAPA
ncbi:DUF4267 domain-containing protein [Microbacterium sp. ARD32]|uniref:DUF4267 domain-containing protein n=1 Tax=Microbacterium sp. ARD32 TaxID=2962577 RepID=UPI002882355B|nr:DUF4267 domain-containing protein [Microbacterium sp. ARD32]MDT0157002.1 DUF4267 domain-containing protein [Microbacterium sp. ARD32]